ncbi:MAG: LacI family transcriptional regulator [Propionibacteriaceae bacterium]|jgi:DNA-binding LacI/PurR family transcriptional regulator|nr:LacI family transcriptional regulator [Propionibacteriaceae bacterium]
MAVSIEDVARKAGVSTATVSRTLRGLDGVGEETRKRVQAIVKELRYVPSVAASNLARGSTRTIGVVAPSVSRWFFGAVIEGAGTVFAQRGYDAILCALPDKNPPRALFHADSLRNRVDGVLIASTYFNAYEVDELRSLDLPAVFISVAQPGFCHVGIDNQAAATKAVEHLIELGHRTIGHISGRPEYSARYIPSAARTESYRQTLAEHGLEVHDTLEAPSDLTAASGYHAAMELLERRPDVTAIFAVSDEVGMGVMQALKEKGLVAGRDVSVASIDGHDLDDAAGLTSVDQHVYKQGIAGATLLLDQIDTQTAPQSIILDTDLVVRSSTGLLDSAS